MSNNPGAVLAGNGKHEKGVAGKPPAPGIKRKRSGSATRTGPVQRIPDRFRLRSLADPIAGRVVLARTGRPFKAILKAIGDGLREDRKQSGLQGPAPPPWGKQAVVGSGRLLFDVGKAHEQVQHAAATSSSSSNGPKCAEGGSFFSNTRHKSQAEVQNEEPGVGLDGPGRRTEDAAARAAPSAAASSSTGGKRSCDPGGGGGGAPKNSVVGEAPPAATAKPKRRFQYVFRQQYFEAQPRWARLLDLLGDRLFLHLLMDCRLFAKEVFPGAGGDQDEQLLPPYLLQIAGKPLSKTSLSSEPDRPAGWNNAKAVLGELNRRGRLFSPSTAPPPLSNAEKKKKGRGNGHNSASEQYDKILDNLNELPATSFALPHSCVEVEMREETVSLTDSSEVEEIGEGMDHGDQAGQPGVPDTSVEAAEADGQKAAVEAALANWLSCSLSDFVAPLVQKHFVLKYGEATSKIPLYYRKEDWALLERAAERNYLKQHMARQGESELVDVVARTLRRPKAGTTRQAEEVAERAGGEEPTFSASKTSLPPSRSNRKRARPMLMEQQQAQAADANRIFPEKRKRRAGADSLNNTDQNDHDVAGGVRRKQDPPRAAVSFAVADLPKCYERLSREEVVDAVKGLGIPDKTETGFPLCAAVGNQREVCLRAAAATNANANRNWSCRTARGGMSSGATFSGRIDSSLSYRSGKDMGSEQWKWRRVLLKCKLIPRGSGVE
eukprot:g2678.t1